MGVAARDTAKNIFLRPRFKKITTILRIGVASITCLLCLLVAATVDDVGTVVAYNGAVFGTPVCYIVPCVMYTFLPTEIQSRPWYFACVTCAILGVLFSILGVVVVTFDQFQ